MRLHEAEDRVSVSFPENIEGNEKALEKLGGMKYVSARRVVWDSIHRGSIMKIFKGLKALFYPRASSINSLKDVLRWFVVFQSSIINKLVSGFCSIGIAVGSNTRGQRVKWSHGQNFIKNIKVLLIVQKTKIKKAANGPFFKKQNDFSLTLRPVVHQWFYYYAIRCTFLPYKIIILLRFHDLCLVVFNSSSWLDNAITSMQHFCHARSYR